ncbi:MAG TPA: prepilin peptidase [Novosphingobium sp.]
MLAWPILSKGVLVAACLAAGWGDLSVRRIPNWLCAATAIAGLGFAFLAGGWPALGAHAAHAALALVIGMGLFAVGAFGGGDAKFYAAVAAWFALGEAAVLLMAVALCGLVLLLVWFTYRRAAGKPVRRTGGDPADSLPYGLAIGGGAMIGSFMLA